MATTNITMRIDEKLKGELQTLVSELGIDMTTFFVMAAKQAVREQALPFHPTLKTDIYNSNTYEFVKSNTNYNKNGKATIKSSDEWVDETEWDDLYNKMKDNNEKPND